MLIIFSSKPYVPQKEKKILSVESLLYHIVHASMDAYPVTIMFVDKPIKAIYDSQSP